MGSAAHNVRSGRSSKWIRRPKRLAIYRRDGWTCFYCTRRLGASRLSLDHIVPRCAGGTHAASNLITACFACNSARREVELTGRQLTRALRQARRPVDYGRTA
jgi:5-methylcytosine-specific restriction endonuclease McrA